LLARQITHKNVVRIHDLGEIDGIKYITMPYIEGEDLSSVLKKSGKLPVAAVMPIARQIAAGLEAAHEAGVVHRDLKPANIMLEKGDQAIIMDFGIARTAARAEGNVTGTGAMGRLDATLEDAVTHAAATVAGAVVGTIEYMAPEQARGQDVDQRADIYAFGLMLYDMLVGRRRAQHAASAIGELQKRLEESPPPVRSAVPEVPEPLDRLVSRCIEADAAKRFQTTKDLVIALDRLDDNGRLRPIRRVVGLPLASAVATLLLALVGGVWWYTRPPVQHDPVSVVIADFTNSTGDTAFDGTLEPMLKRVLDDSGFITAYERNSLGGLGVQRDTLEETAAREVAVQQGLGVVLAGSIVTERNGYRIALKATESVTNAAITQVERRAATKDDVLATLSRLAGQVRNAMGDDTSETAQQFAGNRISTASLDVVGYYAQSVQASASNKFEEAREHALKTVELDPKFGLGYMIAAVTSGTLGRLDDQRKYLDLALQNLEGMTERERYLTRGYSYLAANDYQQCVKEYNEAVVRYKADVSGRNNLALCLSKLRQLHEAMQVMQEVVKLLPRQPLFRDNLALYAAYAGDFETAEKEARAVEGPDAYATLALALAQSGQGRLSQAKETYQSLAGMRRGASFASSGLGDMAILEGRFSEAVRILRQGVTDDVAAENLDSATGKLAAIAYAELSRGQNRAAIEAAEEALRRGNTVKTRFLSARTFVEAGDAAKARPIIDGLANELYAEPLAYAKILEGLILLKSGDARRAIPILRQANEQFDTWIGLFDLGRASLAAGLFAQADSAFDTCLNARRGEALSLFLDEEPTSAFLAPVHYYLGQARQGLKSPRYADSYRAYVTLRGNSKEDPLLAEVRKLAGS